VKNTTKDFAVDVVVLFSSPSTHRWSTTKQGNDAVGFGMKIPNESE
jgi:hypothetical protein